MIAIERIGTVLTAQTRMIGPMSTVSLGFLLLDEPFNGWIIAGTILMVIFFWLTRAARV
jgi:drug/metabolite transporter (DMT)-like permease